jgi:Na+/H+ antiporter NhaD/arsenite permease-like protein
MRENKRFQKESTLNQMALAIIVFLIAYIVIATEKFPRPIVALLGGVVLVVLNVFDLKEAFAFVDWETMGLLFGMFILVEILKEAGFFNWMANTVARKLNYEPIAIFVAFPILAGVMSAFMDSITVMLFLSALTVRLARLINIDPVPMIVAEVCCANAGGASTLVGDPPNVILGTILGFNFNDFVIHTGPSAMLSVLAIVAVFYAFNRKMLFTAKASREDTALAISGVDEEANPKLLPLGLIAFSAAIVLLITHSALPENAPIHISAATAALLPAFAAVIIGGKATHHTATKIDIESLLFFIGLFIMVGALEKTGVIGALAGGIAQVGIGNTPLLLMLLHWGSGITSGLVDNIPMALAMAYVMKDLAKAVGAPALAMMTWALALGIDIGGNMTPVGASANVVAYTFMERNVGKVGWWRWIKMAVPPTVVAMALCSVLLLIKNAIGWW